MALAAVNATTLIKGAVSDLCVIARPGMDMGSDAYNDLVTIRSEMDNMLSDEAYGKSRDRLIREYARTLPKGSPLATASYGLLSVLAGAGIGATAGAANARLTGEDVTAKTIEGAAKGGILGAAASVPITAGHWLYNHPNQTAKVLRLVKGMSQPAAQAIKQVKQSGQSGVVTHFVYDPDKGLTPAEQTEQPAPQ